jgi:N-methylhydantoinase A
VNRLFAEMEDEGRRVLGAAGVAIEDVRVSRIAEMRYVGQGHELEAAVPAGTLSAASIGAITESFETVYRTLYHRLPQGVPIEALNWRVTVAGPAPGITVAGAAVGDGSAVRKGTRAAWFAEAGGFVDTPVYDRYTLAPGTELGGPVIVEERESTAVIGPGARCRVDAARSLLVEMPA